MQLDKNILNFINQYTFDNINIPIIWIDSDGRIIYHNDIVNYYSGESNLIGTYIYRIASDIKEENWNNLWDILIDRTNYNFVHVFYNKTKDELFTFNVYSSLVNMNNEKYCYLYIIDITELVKTNHRLLKEKDKAKESERLKDAFLSNMSHEIRTPMNAIVGFTEILDDSIQDELLSDYIKIISNNVDYLLTLIDNIITISRIDSYQITVKNDKFNINNLINSIVLEYKNKIKKNDKDLTIRANINFNTPLIINTDKYIIEDMFIKLIDNSIKFSKDGVIEIGYELNKNKIKFFVKDEGIGIENRYHSIIFDRFKQISKQTIGSGLGLSIFKSYINLLNGCYLVESKINEGTTIYFILNINYTENKKINIDDNLKTLKGKKIMVVEDLEVNQLLIHDLLIQYEVDIISCMNGKDCLDVFNNTKNIDMILMDLNMPIMNGYEVTKLIREKDKVIPIIAQTAYAQKENRERARRIGFTDFITKPILKDTLLEVILKHI